MRGLTPFLLALQAAIPLISALAIEDRHDHDDGPGCAAPPPKSCASKAKDLKWTVHGFDYHASYLFTTPAHQNSWGYVNFNLTNTAVPYTASCSAASNQLSDFFYGTQWYTCTLPATAPVGAAVTFTYNRPSGELDVNETVVCDGKGTGPTTTFHAAGTTTLSLSCTDTTWNNPNWTQGSGEFYSDREVKCAPVDVTITPYQVV